MAIWTLLCGCHEGISHWHRRKKVGGVLKKCSHIFLTLWLKDSRMRNCVVSEVKDLKNLLVTNVLFDPCERVQVSMASSGFYTDHRTTTGRPLGFVDFPKHWLKEESWSVETEKTKSICKLYGTCRQRHSTLGKAMPCKMAWWLQLFAADEEIHLFYGEFNSTYLAYFSLLWIVLSLKTSF